MNSSSQQKSSLVALYNRDAKGIQHGRQRQKRELKVRQISKQENSLKQNESEVFKQLASDEELSNQQKHFLSHDNNSKGDAQNQTFAQTAHYDPQLRRILSKKSGVLGESGNLQIQMQISGAYGYPVRIETLESNSSKNLVRTFDTVTTKNENLRQHPRYDGINIQQISFAHSLSQEQHSLRKSQIIHHSSSQFQNEFQRNQTLIHAKRLSQQQQSKEVFLTNLGLESKTGSIQNKRESIESQGMTNAIADLQESQLAPKDFTQEVSQFQDLDLDLQQEASLFNQIEEQNRRLADAAGQGTLVLINQSQNQIDKQNTISNSSAMAVRKSNPIHPFLTKDQSFEKNQKKNSMIQKYQQIEGKILKFQGLQEVKFNKSFNMNLIRNRREIERRQKIEQNPINKGGVAIQYLDFNAFNQTRTDAFNSPQKFQTDAIVSAIYSPETSLNTFAVNPSLSNPGFQTQSGYINKQRKLRSKEIVKTLVNMNLANQIKDPSVNSKAIVKQSAIQQQHALINQKSSNATNQGTSPLQTAQFSNSLNQAREFQISSSHNQKSQRQTNFKRAQSSYINGKQNFLPQQAQPFAQQNNSDFQNFRNQPGIQSPSSNNIRLEDGEDYRNSDLGFQNRDIHQEGNQVVNIIMRKRHSLISQIPEESRRQSHNRSSSAYSGNENGLRKKAKNQMNLYSGKASHNNGSKLGSNYQIKKDISLF